LWHSNSIVGFVIEAIGGNELAVAWLQLRDVEVASRTKSGNENKVSTGHGYEAQV
jgi:hypothetical protein